MKLTSKFWVRWKRVAIINTNIWKQFYKIIIYIIFENEGGCGNSDPKAYWTNPQYPLTFAQNKANSELSIVISLMQTESVRKRTETNGQFEDSFEDLSFRIYEVKSGADELAKYDSSQLTEVAKLPYYLAAREVTKRIRLRPGKYVIIPSLFEKNVNMKFLLRVFYESLDEMSRSANESLSGDQNKTKSSDLKLPEKIMLPQNGPATVSSYDVIGKDGDSLKQKTRNVNSEAY